MVEKPIPATLFEVFPASHVLDRGEDGAPSVVCVMTASSEERAQALPFLQQSPASFVLEKGVRYAPDGSSRPYEPTCPVSAEELSLSFDVEWVAWGPPPRVYVLTYTEHAWEQAKQAMRQLFQQGKLAPLSYLEGRHNERAQGVCVSDLDARPHGPGLVALIRTAAFWLQNDPVDPNEEGSQEAPREAASGSYPSWVKRPELEEDDFADAYDSLYEEDDAASPADGEEEAWQADADVHEAWDEEEDSRVSRGPGWGIRAAWARLTRWWKGGAR